MKTIHLSYPKCKNRMEQGFIADEAYGAVLVSKWVEGVPEKSFWSGTKTKGKKQLPIVTYCCTNCGYLESYAK